MPKIAYQAKIEVLDSFNMHYVPVPKKTVKQLGMEFKARLLCTLNKKIKFSCGLIPLGEGIGFIMLSKARMKEIGVQRGSSVKVELVLDKSKYGLPMAEELEELLKQDDKGRERFDKLTPGKQRTILYYVGSVKDTDARLERAILLITNLKKATPGKETFRQMLGIKN
ncbi:MAG: YdeI/OmpD-associated family protein [Xanthomonadaceae bacterium]|nr:YdeI/OmpD-associated family protein [Xanthomonadaceae bacterium]